MPKFDASKAQFFLEIGSLPLTVVDFQGKEKLSQLFQYDINLVSEQEDIDFKEAINKSANLVIKRGDDEIILHGIIAKFASAGILRMLSTP